MARMAFEPVRRSDQPVRMRPVQVTVFIYHLKLNPETEFQSHLFYFLR